MKMAKTVPIAATISLGLLVTTAVAQSNSLFMSASVAQQQAAPAQPKDTWPTASVPITYGMSGSANPGVQNTSLFAVQLPAPRVFRMHDLITIVIKEEKRYKHDAETDNKNGYDINAKLDDWFRIHNGWQQQQFPNGKPKITAKIDQNLDNSSTAQRTDTLATRMTVEIIDVKPNGTLSLKGRKTIKTDNDEQDFTLTGTCRAEDVGPDNTILSTQIHDMNLSAKSSGAVRDAASPGWLAKLLGKAKPF